MRHGHTPGTGFSRPADVEREQVPGQDDGAVEVRARQRDPLGLGARLGRGDRVGEDEGPHPVACRGACRVLDRRVVVEHVEQPGQADRLDQIGPHHRVHEHVRSGTQLVQSLARDRVTGDDHRRPALFDPEADRGSNRRMIGRRGA